MIRIEHPHISLIIQVSSYLVVTAGLLNGQILLNYSFGKIVLSGAQDLNWKAGPSPCGLSFHKSVQEEPGYPALLLVLAHWLFKI